jgi:hypothetical protein
VTQAAAGTGTGNLKLSYRDGAVLLGEYYYSESVLVVLLSHDAQADRTHRLVDQCNLQAGPGPGPGAATRDLGPQARAGRGRPAAAAPHSLCRAASGTRMRPGRGHHRTRKYYSTAATGPTAPGGRSGGPGSGGGQTKFLM